MTVSSAVSQRAGPRAAQQPTQVIALDPDQAAARLAERAIVTPEQLSAALAATRTREPIRLGDFLLEQRQHLVAQRHAWIDAAPDRRIQREAPHVDAGNAELLGQRQRPAMMLSLPARRGGAAAHGRIRGPA